MWNVMRCDRVMSCPMCLCLLVQQLASAASTSATICEQARLASTCPCLLSQEPISAADATVLRCKRMRVAWHLVCQRARAAWGAAVVCGRFALMGLCHLPKAAAKSNMRRCHEVLDNQVNLSVSLPLLAGIGSLCSCHGTQESGA